MWNRWSTTQHYPGPMLLLLVLTLAALAPPRHLASACTTSQTVGNVGEAIMHNLGEEHVSSMYMGRQ